MIYNMSNGRFGKSGIQIFTIFIIVLGTSCAPRAYNSNLTNRSESPSRSDDIPPRPAGKPGECWQLVEVPRQYESNRQIYYEYTGNKQEEVAVTERTVVIQPATELWVKKQVNNNCMSPDPKDCLVWCLEKTAAVTETFYEVRDTAAVKEYKEKVLMINNLKSDQHKDWIQVVCDNQLTKEFMSDLKNCLLSRSYQVPPDCSKNIKCLLPALKEFQSDYEFNVGTLNYDSLKALGMEL